MESREEAMNLLRGEVSGLAVDEILALCFSSHSQKNPDRLRLYLDVLRPMGGERAQFASCLICFDLARQGDTVAQLEFSYLTDTIRILSAKPGFVEALVGGDPYASYVWELCQAQLEEMDPTFADMPVSPATPEVADVGAFDLLSDADFPENDPEQSLPDFKNEVNSLRIRARFEEAVLYFLGGELGVPVYEAGCGFQFRNGRDAERIEAFIRELDSVRDFVPHAVGFRALSRLFYATGMRSKSFFGSINQRKQDLLRSGLEDFCASGPEVADVATLLTPLHAEPDAWPRIADMVVDYLMWMVAHPEAAAVGPSAYAAVERLIEREARRGRR